MTTQAVVPLFSRRVLRHWFVTALWAHFRTGAANSFLPWASSMRTQGPEEQGLIELIESASVEE